jgi:competence protein ComEC
LLTGWGWAAFAASGLLDISRRIVSWHADWEPQWRIPDPPVWLAVLFAAAVLLLCAGLRYRWRANWVVTGACLTLLGVIAIHPFAPNAVPRFLELTAIDVGQGESLMLALPEGGVVLVDTGGLAVFGSEEPPRLDTGEDVVAPYLWSRGFRRIDALALSHIHQDHAGGAPALIENFRPAELWIGERADSALWRRIEAAARTAGTRIRFLRCGDTIHLGGARFDTLAPREWEFPPVAGSNEDSMLLRVSYGRHRLLLTGDLGRRMERQLLDAGEPGRIDVLKVAHHGSRRSSHPDFLDAIRPAVAIISAGFENPFRLPSPAVVADLKSRGVMVLRTDLDGLVTTRSDGRRLEVDGVRFHNSGN